MKMKWLAMLMASGVPFALMAEEEHDHAGETKKEHADHDHEDDDDHDHDHDEGKKGPHGGMLVESVTPHLELVVGKDRKLRIRFVGEKNEVVAPGEQVITAVAGERAKPVKLTFTEGTKDDEGVLVADKPLPEGAHVPLILQIKVSAEAKTVVEKLQLHLH